MIETKQIVVFTVGGMDFGFPIEHVNEIIKYIPVTDIPDSPTYVEGVCNLRGEIHMILSLKDILRLDNKNNDLKSYIVIANNFKAGLIVDEVKMILSLNSEDIVTIDSMPKYINNQNIQCIVKNDDKIIYVLNLNNILDRSLIDGVEYSQ